MTRDYHPTVIERTGDRALKSNLALLGEGASGSGGQYPTDWTRGFDVRIYARENGGYVVARERWSRWQGESDYHEADVCTTPDGVLAWLRGETEDTPHGHDQGLRTAEREAWDAACVADPAGLGSIQYEEV